MKLEPKNKNQNKPKLTKKYQNKPVQTKEKKESAKFGIRFMGWLASNLGIPGYSHMSIATLQLKVGLYLIKKSNLVQSDLFDDLNL